MPPAPNIHEYFPGFSACQPVLTVGTAATSRVTMASAVTAVTGDVRGTRVWGLAFHPGQNVVADGVIFVWLRKSGGTNLLIGEVQVAGFTASGTIPGPDYKWKPAYDPFSLASGDVLSVTTTNAEFWTVCPIAAHFSENIV